MRRCLFLVATLLLPIAAAGSEADPEITDGADVPNKSADIVAVWLKTQQDGVRVTFKIHTVRSPVPQNIYELDFRLDGRSLSPAIGWDWDGALHTSLYTPTGWGARPEQVDDKLRDPQFRAGSPALLSFTIPWNAAPGFDKDARMDSLYASTVVYDASQERWVTQYDEAGGGFFGRLGAATFHADGSAWPVFLAPAVVVACAGAGAYAGWRILRARRNA